MGCPHIGDKEFEDSATAHPPIAQRAFAVVATLGLMSPGRAAGVAFRRGESVFRNPQRAMSGAGLWRVAAALAIAACSHATEAPNPSSPKLLTVQVHRSFPHDSTAFTQGLVWWRGKLYESTGRRGESELRRIDPVTGAIERRVAIPVLFFGEGLARLDERLAMLTWHAGQVILFDIGDFERLGAKRYRGEGWGLCHDGTRFAMSDGSARLTFRDSRSFAVIGSVEVTLDGAPLPRLNELECVDGAVYANVFGANYLVRIDPATGRVTHRVDAAGLLDAHAQREAGVLNGIAYDPRAKRFYLTGKLWPVYFEATFK